MTAVADNQANATAPPATDERISFRGPVQRMLVSPEIGALIGAVLVWALFWGVGDRFGTASGTASFLDVAAPLGIMAVAVALLMIGGEFDLSAGMMTGATGILVGLMANNFMGDGASLYLAVPAAFIAAGSIGWFNGTMVNRTGLPSFIVTLGTFFVLRGVNLVFAKRLVDKVVVGGIDDAGGFETFRKIFASVHSKQPFGARDGLFIAMAVIGVLLITFGLLEQSFVRRSAPSSAMLLPAAGGVAATAAGFAVLHVTDGVAMNVIGAALGAAGVIVGAAGFAGWRYETRVTGGGFGLGAASRRVVIGVVAVLLGCVLAIVLDRDERKVILSWLPSLLRDVVAVVAVALAVGLSVRRILAHIKARSDSATTAVGSYVKMVLVVAVVGLAALVGTLALFQLTTVQAARSLLFMGLVAFGMITLLLARQVAGRISASAQLLVGVIAVAALVVVALVARAQSEAVRFRSGLFAAILLAAIALAANTVIESRTRKRVSADPPADRRGRMAIACGVGVAFLGLVMRLLWSGQPFRISVFWWLLAAGVATFVLIRTKYGNWIFAVGGNKEAARSIGVPAAKVKVGLFMTTSLAGCFVGMMTALRLTSVQAQQGQGDEFEYIIAAVVGGNLLTGGYGSAAGAAIGAVIMAMTQIGIPYAGWNQDGRFIVLGAILLLAVLVNNFVRKKAQEAR